MLITVRGWGRDSGKTTIMDGEIRDAESADRYSWGETYLHVDNPKSRSRWAKVRIATGTEVRLGGRYLLEIQLSREEIAHLFFKTHSGDIVRLFQSFMEDEERQEAHRRWLSVQQSRERVNSAQEGQRQSTQQTD
jgi:hypothetical protein